MAFDTVKTHLLNLELHAADKSNVIHGYYSYKIISNARSIVTTTYRRSWFWVTHSLKILVFKNEYIDAFYLFLHFKEYFL